MAYVFVKGCLSEGGSRNLYSPITRFTLKSFDDMTKASKPKSISGKSLQSHFNPNIIFRRALTLLNVREDVNIENTHPVGLIPLSLFHENGTMRKIYESDLMHSFEEFVEPIFCLNDFDLSRTVLIGGGFGLIQGMDSKALKTLGDLASSYVRSLSTCFGLAKAVMDVFDRYDVKHSVKSAEKFRRSSAFCGQKVYQVIDGRALPERKKSLSNSDNK